MAPHPLPLVSSLPGLDPTGLPGFSTALLQHSSSLCTQMLVSSPDKPDRAVDDSVHGRGFGLDDL